MLTLLRNRFERWITARHPVRTGAVSIERERLYIVPSGFGYFFGLVLFVLFLWSVNYNNSMGFVLTFLLAAVALNSMWRCHNNLLQLSLRPLDTSPAFAGQTAQFVYELAETSKLDRHDVAVQWRDSPASHIDVNANGVAHVRLPLAATQRGWLRPGRVRVWTQFPLGLFHAWTWQTFEQACLVYPRPAGTLHLPNAEAANTLGASVTSAATGSDDYIGLRAYVPGDSPRHIAWKSSARGGAMVVKRFAAQQSDEIMLDWHMLGALSPEARLSQLCLWVLKADESGARYGLRLPGYEIAPAHGAAHNARCLRALALF